MKHDRIPTRRQPVRKTLSARLFNRTKAKQQRATAATADSGEMEDGGINISRSLTIIFAIHILAIGMIFIHKQYLSGRTETPVTSAVETSVPATAPVAPTTASARDGGPPILSNGDKPYMVEKGDNYSIIAAKHSVDESELRSMNRGADIRAGVVLRIPEPRRIVAEPPPEVTAIRDQAVPNASEQGLVEILPKADAEQPQLIRATHRTPEGHATPAGSGRTHTVKQGENIWRISNQYKVSQKDLLAINGITDPGKLKIGQVLKLP